MKRIFRMRNSKKNRKNKRLFCKKKEDSTISIPKNKNMNNNKNSKSSRSSKKERNLNKRSKKLFKRRSFKNGNKCRTSQWDSTRKFSISNHSSKGINSKDDIASSAIEELTEWFGKEVETWDILEIQHINAALPELTASDFDKIDQNNQFLECGDHTYHGSVEGALQSAVKLVKNL